MTGTLSKWFARTTWRRPMPALALALVLLAAGCASDASDAQPAEPSAPSQTGGPATEGSENEAGVVASTSDPSSPDESPGQTAEADDADGSDSSDPLMSFELVGATTSVRSLPPGATEVAFQGFVGASAEDPRFIELALLDFDDPSDARAFLDELRGRDFTVDTGADDIAVAFFEGGSGPNEVPRRRLDLPEVGPLPDSLFARALDERRVVYGAAKSVHHLETIDLLNSLADDGTLAFEPPAGLRSSATTTLGGATTAQFRSLDGPMFVTVYDNSAEWLQFAGHGNNSPLPEEFVDAGFAEASHEPPSSFGFSGEPTEAQTLTVASGDHLVSVEYPPAMAHSLVAEIVTRSEGLSGAELLAAFGDATIEVGGESQETEEPEDAVAVGNAPDQERLAELQSFVEAERELLAAGPIAFEFLDAFSGDVPPAFFVTGEMWTLAVMLELVDPTVHDPVSAGLARAERVRGVPGAVVLQPSVEFTEWIVVHEMVHVVEAGAVSSSGSGEIIDPGQALVEGSAQRVALAFAETLPAGVVESFGEFPWIFPPEGDPRLTAEMQDLIEFAYDEGADFAVALHAARGNAGLDDAFVDPPVSSEHILFPQSYLEGDAPVAVDAPQIPASAEVVSDGSLGAYVLSLTIREGDVTTDEELAVVRTWAGDRYAIYDLDGQRCLVARIEMDDAPAAEALAAALENSERAIERDGAGLELAVCREVS